MEDAEIRNSKKPAPKEACDIISQKEIVESLPGIFYLFDQNNKFIEWNKKFEEVSEYSAKEIAKMGPLDFFGKIDKEKVKTAIDDVFTKGQSSVEAFFVQKGGKPIPYLFTGRKIFIGGQPHLSGLGIDISERKMVEEKAKLFSDAVNSTKDGIQITDLNGNVIYSNEAIREMYGFTAEEYQGRNVIAMNVDSRMAGGEVMASIKKNGKWSGELMVKHKDGSMFPISLSASAVKNSAGDTVATMGVVRDLTEQKEAEKKIKEAEKHYTELIEATPLCIKVFDKDRKMIFLNRGGREEHHIKDTDDISKWDWVGTVKKEYQAEAIEKFQKAFTNGESSTLEFEHTPEGSNHEWCSSLVSPVKDEEGNVKSVLFLSSDITALKKAELAAKEAEKKITESEKRYRELIEATPLCVKVFDKDGKLKFINRGGREEHFIKDDDDITKWDWVATVKPAYQESVKKVFEGALKGTAGEVDMEHTPEGAAHAWCHGLISPIKNAQGKVESVLFYSVDITDIKKAEAELLRVTEQGRSILESSGEGILGLDIDGKHTFVNPAAAKMLGHEASEMVGQPSHSMWHYKKEDGNDFPKTDCPIYAVYKDGIMHEGESYFWKKDGSGFPASFKSRPIKEKGKLVGAVVTFSDITKRKADENALAQKAAELEQINDAMVNRELKMVELKKQIKELEEKLKK